MTNQIIADVLSALTNFLGSIDLLALLEKVVGYIVALFN